MFGLGTLRRVVREVSCDVASARDRDPAARGVGTAEILTSWAGVQALLAHRVAHALYEAQVPLLPRTIAFASRAVTGVEIHPAASVGQEFFIDHGSGVVIGETAEIGDRVTLYQGVTLGGTGFARGKRHPTVEDDVTIGSGAKLLGPVTVGHGAKVGANTVVMNAGARIMLTSVSGTTTTSMLVNTRLASRRSAAKPSMRSVISSTGIIAPARAPPAIMLPIVSGRRNAA